MTWREAQLSLQLAAEERAGFVMRFAEGLKRAQVEASFAALKAATEV